MTETSYLTDLAEVLWPCGGLLGRGGPAAQARPPRDADVREYLPVPSARNPRVILPVSNRSAAVRGIAAFTQRHSLWDRIRSTLLSAAFACGVAPLLLRDRLRVAAGRTIQHALSAALERDLVIAIHVGPPRAGRKPVLVLLTPEGRTVGYAKLGIDALTSRLVSAEAAALRRLAGAELAHITVPRLLHDGEWSGRPLLVQNALPMEGHTEPPTQRQLLRCVARIARINGLTSLPLSASDYRGTLLERVTALGRRPETAVLRGMLTRLADVRLPFGAWHGDLTRWNIATSPRGTFIWDWERLDCNAPVGFDALHYELHESMRLGTQAGINRWLDSGARLLRDPLLLGPAARPETVSTVMALYLIELAARYLHDLRLQTGGRHAMVDMWLLPALAYLIEHAGRSPAPA